MHASFNSMNIVGKTKLFALQIVCILQGNFNKNIILVFGGIENIIVFGLKVSVQKINIRNNSAFKIKRMPNDMLFFALLAFRNNWIPLIANINFDPLGKISLLSEKIGRA